MVARFPAALRAERRRNLPRRRMAGDEAGEEVARIGAERAHAVAALLHHERGIALLADHVAELLEILAAVGPGAGRIAARGVEARATPRERLGRNRLMRRKPSVHRVSVLLGGDVLGQRHVEIVAGAGPDARLVAEAGEVRIGEARMAVDRDGQHVGARVEDLLLAVAMVIVDVEDGDPAVARQADWRRSPHC